MEGHSSVPPLPVETEGKDRTDVRTPMADAVTEGKDRTDVRTPMADADGREGQDGCKDSYGGCYDNYSMIYIK